jgi:hypothetical protein
MLPASVRGGVTGSPLARAPHRLSRWTVLRSCWGLSLGLSSPRFGVNLTLQLSRNPHSIVGSAHSGMLLNGFA